MRAGWNKLFSVFRCFFLGNNTISYYTGDAAKLISSSQFFDYITYVILPLFFYFQRGYGTTERSEFILTEVNG